MFDFFFFQAYHSQLLDYNQCVGNIAMLPFKTQYRGPAPPFTGGDTDIVDESIYYFKANVFFRNYEIKVNTV
jgi:actin related protein 2/3 complex subunit 3